MTAATNDRHALYRGLLWATQAQACWQARLDAGGSVPLSSFLDHVTSTVPFYRSLAAGAPGRDPGDLLRALPALSRAELAGSLDRFVSDAFDQEALHWKATSGTTGEPLRIPRDPGSRFGFAYDSFRELARFLPALRACAGPGETGVVRINDNPDREPGAALNPALQNALFHGLVLGRGDSADEQLVLSLRALDIPVLYGRPRALLRLIELDEALPPGSARIRARAVLTSGDNLYPDDRARLEAWLGGRVHNAYVSQEAGFTGVECAHRTGIHLLSSRVRMEVRRDDGDIADTGAGELVATNLENWALPFVRYRSGDAGEIARVACPCGHTGATLVALSGRDSVYFFFGDRRVNPSIFNPMFEGLPLRRFQVVQQATGALRLRWVARDRDVDTGAVHRAMRAELGKLLGAVDLGIERVDAIGRPGQKVQRYVRERGTPAGAGGQRHA